MGTHTNTCHICGANEESKVGKKNRTTRGNKDKEWAEEMTTKKPNKWNVRSFCFAVFEIHITYNYMHYVPLLEEQESDWVRCLDISVPNQTRYSWIVISISYVNEDSNTHGLKHDSNTSATVRFCVHSSVSMHRSPPREWHAGLLASCCYAVIPGVHWVLFGHSALLLRHAHFTLPLLRQSNVHICWNAQKNECTARSRKNCTTNLTADRIWADCRNEQRLCM